MRIPAIFTLLLCINYTSFSTPLDSIESASDSLVFTSDLSFTYAVERKMYFELLAGSQYEFDLLMTINSSVSEDKIQEYKTKLYDEIDYLKTLERPTNPKKKVKYYRNIYDEIHARFLKKYELINHFNSVFTDGEYNCVSACALYGMVFNALEIPFSIKETPTHVYIVVDPGTDQFLIETTDPTNGVNKLSSNFKSRFVKELEMSKIISHKESASLSVDELFDKYYFNHSNLGMTEIVGVQYWNEGIYALSEEDYELAMDAFQKSCLLYPNEKVEELLLGTIALQISQYEYKSVEDSKLIVYLSRFDEKKITDKQLSDEFLRLNQHLLINRGDVTNYRKSYEYIVENIPRQSAKDDISFHYNFEMARTIYNKGRYQNGIAFSAQSYGLRPNNMDAENLLLSYLGQILQNGSDFLASFELLDSLSDTHPQLLENNRFGEIYLNYSLLSMDESARAYKITDAKVFKSKFENTAALHPYFQFNTQLLGSAYSELAIYYFKKGHNNTAIKIINEGLVYDARNYELMNRKRAIEY
ncbi:MAG: hypothetical protein OCD76_13300 [Reichenbachiella sp.]